VVKNDSYNHAVLPANMAGDEGHNFFLVGERLDVWYWDQPIGSVCKLF